MSGPRPLRLPVGSVTVLLGPLVQRRRTMNRLDDASGRCADGHDALVRRLGARRAESAAQRLATVESARTGPTAMVLADRLTDGLDARDRIAVLAALRELAASGVAVLVDDIDPVAALAVADSALRVDERGEVRHEELAYLAS
ncbi:ABC transporter ATP-binding protein [Pseudonocardia sp. HH130630-07]|uniref:ABC transporter ATP-binding protein n=1 Tax=Pseudonocardia sp. HH130630-07 TaxID=1690815 RepID=UPI0008153A76|nr:ABC transporter ATP-binding protein [Pseudonocardia sp. HH130630-07]ANY06207.1 hypothetical protein AFB00_07740 [Pseudonocardia sp. HH130630-07]